MADGTPAAFGYSRALAPLLWAFFAIAMVELAVVHLLVSSLWSAKVAWAFSALTFAMLIWIVLLIGSLKRLPVLVEDGGVTMRVGALKSIRLPIAQIAAIRTSWPREALMGGAVLNLALINYPNVMLDLDPPLQRRARQLRSVAHHLDDPSGFAAAVSRLMEVRA